MEGIGTGAKVRGKQNLLLEGKSISELSRDLMERSKLTSEVGQNDNEGEAKSSEPGAKKRDDNNTSIVGGPANW